MPSAAPCDFNVERNAWIESRTITEIALAATAAKYTGWQRYFRNTFKASLLH
jgi:hypothetical protein